MSVSMAKMWISIFGMGCMAVSVLIVYVCRFKLQHPVIKSILMTIAFFLIIIAGITAYVTVL